MTTTRASVHVGRNLRVVTLITLFFKMYTFCFIDTTHLKFQAERTRFSEELDATIDHAADGLCVGHKIEETTLEIGRVFFFCFSFFCFLERERDVVFPYRVECRSPRVGNLVDAPLARGGGASERDSLRARGFTGGALLVWSRVAVEYPGLCWGVLLRRVLYPPHHEAEDSACERYRIASQAHGPGCADAEADDRPYTAVGTRPRPPSITHTPTPQSACAIFMIT